VGDLIDRDIKVIKGDSLRVAQSMDPQEFDIVFLDAGHDYQAIKTDLMAWAPHVANSGVLCGHDFSLVFPDVMRAVTEFVEDVGCQARLVNNTCVWMVLMQEYYEAAQRRQRELREAKDSGHELADSTAPVKPKKSRKQKDDQVHDEPTSA
jgi:hypothetical protein